MAYEWRNNQYRMANLENNLRNHQQHINRHDERNEQYSAKLRRLERELNDLRVDNVRLQDEVHSMRAQEPPDTYRSGQGTFRHEDDHRREIHRDDRERFGDINPANGQSNVRADDATNTESLTRIPPTPERRDCAYYLFIRSHDDCYKDIELSFKKHRTTLNQLGHFIGIAGPEQIRLSGKLDGWKIRGRKDSENCSTSNFLSVLAFPSDKDAQNWVEYDQDFKKSYWPMPDGCDLMLAPIIGQEEGYNTFVLIEFPVIVTSDVFRNEIIIPMADILRKYKCSPFVIRTTNVRHLRGNWIGARSYLVGHTFATNDDAKRFCEDSELTRLKQKLNGITRGSAYTIAIFTVNRTL